MVFSGGFTAARHFSLVSESNPSLHRCRGERWPACGSLAMVTHIFVHLDLNPSAKSVFRQSEQKCEEVCLLRRFMCHAFAPHYATNNRFSTLFNTGGEVHFPAQNERMQFQNDRDFDFATSILFGESGSTEFLLMRLRPLPVEMKTRSQSMGSSAFTKSGGVPRSKNSRDAMRSCGSILSRAKPVQLACSCPGAAED